MGSNRHFDNEKSSNSDTVILTAAYHSVRQQPTSHLLAVAALLPMFPNNAFSVAMIYHSMDVQAVVRTERSIPGRDTSFVSSSETHKTYCVPGRLLMWTSLKPP